MLMHGLRQKTPIARIAVLMLLVAFFPACQGGKVNKDFSNISIKNFGKMDERFYRGAQPREDDYKDLAGLGIQTVIDLRDDPRAYEKSAVEAVGMRYVNIPMDSRTYPNSEHINQFLQVVEDPGTGKFFVHCAGGRHRTGVIGAVYRFEKHSWDYDRAYAEMREYDFYTRWGHGPMEKFVQDYWQQHQSRLLTTEGVK